MLLLIQRKRPSSSSANSCFLIKLEVQEDGCCSTFPLHSKVSANRNSRLGAVLRFDPDTQRHRVLGACSVPHWSAGEASEDSEVGEVDISSPAGHLHTWLFCHSSRRRSKVKSPDLWTSQNSVHLYTLLWRHADLLCGLVLGFDAWWSRTLLWWERWTETAPCRWRGRWRCTGKPG